MKHPKIYTLQSSSVREIVWEQRNISLNFLICLIGNKGTNRKIAEGQGKCDPLGGPQSNITFALP